MDRKTFTSVLDWVDKSNGEMKTIQLIGGEPTLSPFLPDMLEEINSRKHRAVIFSNLTIPLHEAVVSFTHTHDAEWVVNANDPATYSASQAEAVRENLSRLDKHAYLTFNVYSTDVRYGHVFEYIERFRLRPHVKLGIALPTYEKQNEYISPDIFEKTKENLWNFFNEARKRKVTIATECGVPYCLLKEIREEFGDVFVDAVSHCGSRLDVAPDGTLTNCFPLSRTAAVHFSKFGDFLQAVAWFQTFIEPYKSLSCMMDDCFDCRHRLDGTCLVCLANSLGQYNKLVYPPLPVDSIG